MSAILASLRIKNFALVEDALWTPGQGLNVVTGETGAGKSILIGALKLLLGERADRSLIRNGKKEAVIEAAFERCGAPEIAALLDTAGAEPCEDGLLLLKRVISEGTGKQFANGSACNISLLRGLGDLLVDLHGPHDHQSLFSREQQTRLLDQFCGATGAFQTYREHRKQLLDLLAEKESIESGAQADARELDLLRHQTAEIENAGFSAGDEEDLLEQHRAASNAGRIRELSAGVLALLGETEDSIGDRLAEVGRMFRELSRLDARFSEYDERFAGIAALCADLERDLANHIDTVADGDLSLRDLEERLDLLGNLKRKYGTDIAAILAFQENALVRLRELEGRESRGGNLDNEIEFSRRKLQEAAKKLGALRQAGARKLSTAVGKELAALGFLQAGFSIHLEPQEESAPHGAELADFLFAPNPGEPPKPLRQIASSGEISRVMLALKCVLSREDPVALLVFDEIDANVGGETATMVGKKMAELGAARQVLCITHLPQVAAAGSVHFLVEKQVEDGRTQSLLREIESTEREQEIARMLGGKSKTALEHAKNLLLGRDKK